ncbi:hypothetical protein [Photorhabdus australis]|uniref:hypothetical protein n=1 Tax=Photorhabdus australis TaxID=286156 RepID=UPI0008163923|nr:hypothetical protein [Photorhabdus australis]
MKIIKQNKSIGKHISRKASKEKISGCIIDSSRIKIPDSNDTNNAIIDYIKPNLPNRIVNNLNPIWLKNKISRYLLPRCLS